ncbi:MAG: DinB family protein [Bacteroidetes bacterium]|nr:DinB family protein [Bacteroidota bacterium]
MKIGRPKPEESAAYYHTYINLVLGEDPVAHLDTAGREILRFLESIPAAKWDYRYAPGKWTIKEVVMHMIDTERVFAYRALRFGRNDLTELPGFDQDLFVSNAGANNRSAPSLIKEYQHVRDTTMQLLKHLPSEAWQRSGVASGHPVSVRALAYMIGGHELHHLRILKERYLQDETGLA